MTEEILINVTPREVRIALLENGALQEVYVERSLNQGIVGNIYKGKIIRLLPGIQAAFIDIGLDRSGFLHLKDLKDYEEDDGKDIRDFLQVGQEILVQVCKDPLGSKGARLSAKFAIPSRYLVFTPNLFQLSVSQKINNEEERARLMALLKPGDAGGYIFRTSAEGARQAEIEQDKEFLDVIWNEIQQKAKKSKVGGLVYEEIPILLRVLRDFADKNIKRIQIDQEIAELQMKEFARRYIPALIDRIELYADERPIFDLYSIEDEIQKALQRKVFLKSGGYLVIDQTEAMTTIDVNTGSYTGHSNLEQTIFKTNLEACEAIARQMRIRNLGGIIIIDFIDMEELKHRDQLLQLFKNMLAKDYARTELSELSSLGLVQLTRKRTRESLEHILCVGCPMCQRRGFIKSLATIAYEVFRDLKRNAHVFPWSGFLIIVSQSLADYLLDEESMQLAEVESQLGKPIKLRVEASYAQENYDILPLSDKD